MRRLRLSFLICHLSFLFLTACSPQQPNHPTANAQPPNLTPTLLGTANPPTRAPASATPRPTTCIFRTSPTDEIGLYRFDWQNATITLDTKIGALIVDGPRGLTPGPRQLILLHNTQLSPQSSVIVNFDVSGSLIYDPLNSVQEVRDFGGTLVTQTMTDPTGDTKGLPDYMDIARVERTFGYYPTSLVQVYLAGIHPGKYIWTFHSVAVSLAGITFTQRNFFDGTLALTETDSQNRVKEWPGPVTVTDNVYTFALQVGVNDPVMAATTTSSGGGDLAGPYPTAALQKVWEAAKQFCP